MSVDYSESIRIAALAAKSAQLRDEKARRDPNVFNERVLRDETTGERVHQAPYHREMQAQCSENRFAIICGHFESAKTQQVAIGRALFELGRDPTLRIAVLAEAESKQSRKTIMSMEQYIERSDDLHRIFPKLRPGNLWTNDAFNVERNSTAKEPSVQAVGRGGSFQGSRVDLFIVDDLLTYKNMHTEYQRKEVLAWFQAAVNTRLTSRGRVWFLTNAWTRDDPAHTFGKRKGWNFKKYPVRNEDGTSAWPERWPEERIEHARTTLFSPVEFARMMLCDPRSDETSVWQEEYISKCKARGRGLQMLSRLDGVNPGEFVVTGVDLAVGKKDTNHKSVLFTVKFGADQQRSRQVVNIQAGRWGASEILTRMYHTQKRFHSRLRVENVQAQDYIVQLAKGMSIDHEGNLIVKLDGKPGNLNLQVKPFKTGSNKADPLYGVESLAGEMEQGRWIVPCEDNGSDNPADWTCHPEIQAWVEEMLYYDPSGHTGDRLMGAWFAREDAREFTEYRTSMAEGEFPKAGAYVPPPHPGGPGPTEDELRQHQNDVLWNDLHDLIGE